MGKNSAIPWCHHTFNPWWGCTKISPGCENCYAEALARRFGYDVWGATAARREIRNFRDPRKWNREARGRIYPTRVFCGSMCDILEDRRDLDGPRSRLFDLIDETESLTWLLLTKRTGNMIRLTPDRWCNKWPQHVWALTSVENQDVLHNRLVDLVQVPAIVRGISAEPLLGPLRLRKWLKTGMIGWVIAGGESGRHRRPMNENWIRDLRDQCGDNSVPFFYKHRIDADGTKTELPLLDGRRHAQFPTPV